MGCGSSSTGTKLDIINDCFNEIKKEVQKDNRKVCESPKIEGSSLVIDLHWLTQKQCDRYVRCVMSNKPKKVNGQTLSMVVFIPGKGTHTKDGKPKLKPFTMELLKELGYEASVDPHNEGRVNAKV